jgi:diphthamide synthase (EF-2-diphthine--ammonia ligase)
VPLTNQKPKRDVLFWSGGKDAFLALRYLQDESEDDPVLLTTYDDESEHVPYQNIPIRIIQDQAMHLGLILNTIPLSYPASNEQYLEAIKKSLGLLPYTVNHLVFGDLHLEDIRSWREKQFSGMGFQTRFPIWQKPYDELFDRLEDEDVTVKISGVMSEFDGFIKPGDMFTREYAYSLPEQIDRMGENGEFHSEVIFDV